VAQLSEEVRKELKEIINSMRDELHDELGGADCE
jgi:hypothetical protein